mgnify:CR=1 FL=1
MSMQTVFNNEQTVLPVDDQLLTLLDRCVQRTAQLEHVISGEVSISFVDDDAIRELNRRYRQVDQPTDVLSFPMDKAGETVSFPDDNDVVPLLGDIVVSIPHAKKQAEEYGHSFEREMGFLITHGFLHLLGHDHDNEENERDMIAKQKEVLSLEGLNR